MAHIIKSMSIMYCNRLCFRSVATPETTRTWLWKKIPSWFANISLVVFHVNVIMPNVQLMDQLVDRFLVG